MNVSSSYIEDPQVYVELRKALDSESLILFAGSGLSGQATTDDGRHPPGWRGLLTGMVEWCAQRRLIDAAYDRDIRALVQNNFLVEAGQEIHEIFDDPTQLQQCIGEVLLCNEARVREAHNLVASMPFRAYLTTNYDEFIEDEYRVQKGVRLDKFYEDTVGGIMEAYRNRNPFIVKLHGDISVPASIVLGNRSYERFLYSRGTYHDCMSFIFGVASVLFIGFGGADPNVEGIITRIARADGGRKRHWMLVAEGSFPVLKMKRLWRDNGINIIQYEKDEGHTAVPRFLRALAAPPELALTTLKDQTQIKTVERLHRLGNI
jgi:hypothetical protein